MKKPCELCGKIFSRNNDGDSRWAKRRFCSRQCYYKSRVGLERPELRRRVIRQCAACGNSYEAGGRSGHDSASTFCSRRCAEAARWRTGSNAKSLSIAQAAYLAGLVDGEGSILLYKRGTGSAMRLSVANTNLQLLQWCQTITGVGNIAGRKPINAAKHKASYLWLVNSQAGCSVLVQIRPYLVAKAKQADIAIEFQRRLKIPVYKANKEWQEEWRQRVCAMNARGPSVMGT